MGNKQRRCESVTPAPLSVPSGPSPMAQKCANKRRALARAKKMEKQVTGLTTDAGASTTPVGSVASTDPMSETAIESDEQVAVTARPSKAKQSTRSRLGAGVWHTFPCFFLFFLIPFESTF